MLEHLNHHHLGADLRAISAEIKALKRALRASWSRPMAVEQREHARLKLRATELCALTAFSRGKLHVSRPPHGAAADWNAALYHQRIAERLAPSYTLALPESA